MMLSNLFKSNNQYEEIIILKFSFKINGLITIVAIASVFFLIELGIWQLKRAHEKEQLLIQEARQALLPITSWQADRHWNNYQRVRVCGVYLKSCFLLDNQYSNHKIGYNVFTPLVLEDGSLLMVDRGWVPAHSTRAQLPVITSPEQRQCLTGQVYYPSNKAWVLGENIEKKGELTVIEKIDINLMSHLLHKPVYPYIIRLNKDEPYGFTRDWIVVNMAPARHLAYAYQWFAMAFVLSLLFIGLTIKRKHEKK